MERRDTERRKGEREREQNQGTVGRNGKGKEWRRLKLTVTKQGILPPTEGGESK